MSGTRQQPAFAAPPPRARGASAWQWLLLLILLTASAALLAGVAVPQPVEPGYSVRNWQAQDGLPQITVAAIAQTLDGYLWLGTQEGLVRFDGIRFVSENLNGPNGALSSGIWALHVDRAGDLWIGSVTGRLGRLHAGVYTQLADFPEFPISDIWEGPDGIMWVATRGGGVVRIENGQAVRVPIGAIGDRIVALAGDPDGKLLVAGQQQLYRLDGDSWESVSMDGVRAPSTITGLAVADEIVWLGTDSGLYRQGGSGWTRLTLSQDSPSAAAIHLHATANGDLVAGDDRGIWRTRQGQISDGPLVALDVRVLAIFEDREHSLWIGTQLHGLFRIKRDRVTSIGVAHGLSAEVTTSVLQASDGSTWIGTQNGLNQWRNGEVRSFAVDTPQRAIRSLHEDPDGTVWFGSTRGLYGVRKGQVLRHPSSLGEPATAVTTSRVDAEGRLWVGTRQGLFRLDAARPVRFGSEDGLPDDWIRLIEPGRPGELWLGTLHAFGRLTSPAGQYSRVEQVQDAAIMSAHYDARDHSLWIATESRGLLRLRDGKLTRINSANGLASDVVCAVLEGAGSSLWVATGQGIVRLVSTDIDALDAGRIARIPTQRFDESDGMASRECVGGAAPAAWKHADGTLWFPTTRGVAVIDPARLQTMGVPATAIIEEFRVEQIGRALGGRQELPAGSRNLEIRYTGTSLMAPERNRFRYRLNGFDSDWIEADNRRVAYYSTLPPGSYLFEVITTDSTGAWSDHPAVLTFRVLPFPDQLAWSIALGASTILVIGWLIHGLRVRELRARNGVLDERARLSRELHDKLSQTMTGIVLQLDAARHAHADAAHPGIPFLERASHLARAGIDETRRTLRGLRPEELASELSLAQVLRRNIESLTAGTAISVSAESVGLPFALPPEVELELYRIGQEAATNALRHGRAHRIGVTVTYEMNGIRLRVSDDGRGFDTAALSPGATGLGLAGMRERVDRLGGDFKLASQPGAGCSVEVYIPRTT